MKKLLLVLAIGASAVMADVGSKDDLLNIATAGKATGSQLEMSKEDMKESTGGGWLINYYYSRVYPSSFTTTSNGSSSTRTYSNGSSTSYSNYYSGGYSWMRY